MGRHKGFFKQPEECGPLEREWGLQGQLREEQRLGGYACMRACWGKEGKRKGLCHGREEYIRGKERGLAGPRAQVLSFFLLCRHRPSLCLCVAWGSLPHLSLSLNFCLLRPPSFPEGRGLEGLPFPSLTSPPPFLPQVFSPAPYSRQIKCTQLLPAEAGLNCTPVAMAIPDDLRGWNVALRSPCWGLLAAQPRWP